MTGYTVHTGSNLKFSSGWDRIFQGSKSAAKTPKATAKAKKPAKKKSRG